MPSDEAIRRIQAGEPVGSGAGQSAARTQAVAPLLAGFPARHRGDGEPAAGAGDARHRRPSRRSTRSRSALDHRFSNNQSFYARVLYSDGEVDTPDRTVTPRRVLATQQPLNFVANHQSIFGTSVINELKVGFNRPRYDARRLRAGGLRPDAGVALRHRHLAVDRRARHDRRRAQRAAGSRDQQRVDQRPGLQSALDFARATRSRSTRGGHTFKFGGEYRNIASQFRFLGSTEITYAGINEFIDNRPTQVAVSLDSPVFTPQQFYADRLRAGHLARRPAG